MGTLVEKNRDLFELANDQQGLFTAKQAEQVGFVSNNHSYHVKTGNWIREGRGLYRLAHFPKSPEEQKTHRENHPARNQVERFFDGVFGHQERNERKINRGKGVAAIDEIRVFVGARVRSKAVGLVAVLLRAQAHARLLSLKHCNFAAIPACGTAHPCSPSAWTDRVRIQLTP